VINEIQPEYLDRIIDSALDEDLGKIGDLTTLYAIDQNLEGSGQFVVRENGIIAGISVVERVFPKLDKNIICSFSFQDGDHVVPQTQIGTVQGKISSILTAERTVLNFLQRLSGIATLTRKFVDAVKGTKCRILDTRKTTPGLRLLEKYAVSVGGGTNHRMGLFDMVLIKDNHIDANGGITPAVEKCIKNMNQDKKSIPIEVETRTLTEVEEAANLHIQRIMLDNMDTETMRKAVEIIDGRKEVEASGSMNLEKVKETAETGVDFISVGALTHSYKAMDVTLILGHKRI